MRGILLVLGALLLFHFSAVGQRCGVSLPAKEWGIAVGKPSRHTGLQLTAFTKCISGRQVGVAVALLCGSTANMTGLQIGPVNYAQKLYGVQLGLHNWTAHSTGLTMGIYNRQVSAFRSAVSPQYYGSTAGLQLGLVNHTIVLQGVQVGVVNWGVFHSNSPGHNKGVEIGLINAQAINGGVQLGLVNLAAGGKGISIGLLNFRPRNVWWARIMPLVGFAVKHDENRQTFWYRNRAKF